MARINIEDQFWLDIAEVIEKHPNQDKVIGNAIRFFRYSQEEHKKGRLISEEAFKDKGFLEALIPTFAKRTPSGIQAQGAEKHFAWLEQKIKAGKVGGKKSAGRKRDAKGRLVKKGAQIKTSPSELQPSPSPSYSSSNSDSRSSMVAEKSDRLSGSESKTHLLIKFYCERWKEKYGSNPDIVGKDQGIAKRMAKDLSGERIASLLEAYFQMPDAWLIKRKHPLELFESKLKEISVFEKTGKFTTQGELRNLDKKASTASQLDRLERGEL